MNKNIKKKIGLGLALAGLSLALYIDNQCFVAKENKVLLQSPKISSPIKITQISDFHSNALKNLDEVMEKIEKFDPDFIVLTGDILDYGEDRKIERSLYFLKNLSKLKKKTFYITGNHEEAGPKLDLFIKEMEKFGIKYLNNNGEYLEVSGQKIYLYGASMFNFSYENYQGNENSINILLTHFSKNFRCNYKEDIDFVFSGHTHGGQVRFPIIGGLISPGEGFLPNFDKGVYTYKNSTIHIDSGLGNTFLPLRFLDQIQYSNIILAPVV